MHVAIHRLSVLNRIQAILCNPDLVLSTAQQCLGLFRRGKGEAVCQTGTESLAGQFTVVRYDT